MQLAALREKEHPADTIPIYQDEVEREIAGKTNRDYEAAVATMRKVRALMGKVGRGDEFPGLRGARARSPQSKAEPHEAVRQRGLVSRRNPRYLSLST